MVEFINRVKIFKTFCFFLLLFILSGCAYYNTFYNAEQYFKKGMEAREKNKTEKLSPQETQNFDKAIEKSFKVLSDFPDSKYVDDAIFLIGKSYYYKREYGPALKRFEEILFNFPGSEFAAESRIWIAKCLFETGNYQQAVIELRSAFKALKDKSMLANAHYLLAEMMLRYGEFDSAMVHMNKVLEISWDDREKAKTAYRIAEIYLNRGDMARASEFLKKIYRYEVTPELREKAQVLYARIYASSENYEEARKLINRMLADEKNKDVWPALELELAGIYESEKNYTRALSRYESITENYQRTPESAEAYYRMGIIHIYHEIDYEAAKEEFGKVSTEYRDSPFSIESKQRKRELERYLSLMNDIKDAEEKIKQLESISPETASEPTALMDSIKAEGEVSEELSKLRKAFEVKSQLDDANQDTAKIYRDYYSKIYQLGELLFFNLNQPDSAVMKLQKLTENLPYNDFQPQALYMLNYIHQQRGDTLLAGLVKSNLMKNYPDSRYAQLLAEKTVQDTIVFSPAEQLYYRAEKNFHIQPVLSLSILDSVRLKYPEEKELSEKALYSKAFIYDEILLDTSMARLEYEKFLSEYPGSTLAGIVSQRLEFIRSLNSTDADSLEESQPEEESPEEPVKAEPEKKVEIEP